MFQLDTIKLKPQNQERESIPIAWKKKKYILRKMMLVIS